jgi:hypothetical protein
VTEGVFISTLLARIQKLVEYKAIVKITVQLEHRGMAGNIRAENRPVVLLVGCLKSLPCAGKPDNAFEVVKRGKNDFQDIAREGCQA